MVWHSLAEIAQLLIPGLAQHLAGVLTGRSEDTLSPSVIEVPAGVGPPLAALDESAL